MRRSRIIIAAIVIAAIMATGWFVYNRNSSSSANPAVPSTLTESQVSFLETGLNSHHKDEQATILAPALRSGEWSAETILPSGATVKLDQASFVADGMGSAHVNVRVNGSVSAEFVLTLAYIDGQWFLVTSTKK